VAKHNGMLGSNFKVSSVMKHRLWRHHSGNRWGSCSLS